MGGIKWAAKMADDDKHSAELEFPLHLWTRLWSTQEFGPYSGALLLRTFQHLLPLSAWSRECSVHGLEK